MDKYQDFLVEIGTEELPPKALLGLSNAFADCVSQELEKLDLTHATPSPFATPRRLALIVKDLQIQQSTKTVQRRGPAIKAAFAADGTPSKAALGFAKSCGLDSVEQLKQLETDKGAWLVHDAVVHGKSAMTLLPGVISAALDKLPIPKRMRWGDSKVQFVRPVHWIVMLLGHDIVEANLFNIESGRHTRGHRFHRPMEISLEHPDDYEVSLENNGSVLANFEKRRDKIEQQVNALAVTSGGSAVVDPELLDEVTGMVEWPVALLGNFDQRFLKIPAEVLITAMKTHQKYFHLQDSDARMLPNFITVSNIDSKDMAVVREGNERVVMPRLVDAEFFWNQDRKQNLSNFGERLKKVVFQAKLGSMYEKTQRTEQLGIYIANLLGANQEYVKRAAQLSKCDLMTDMVSEFPNLQGIMGKYYAQFSNEEEEIAISIEEHYQPRFAGDKIPETQTGQILAVADKLDSLCGIFALGQVPTGDKDPFALRRAGLGIMRIMVEAKFALDLKPLIQTSLAPYSVLLGLKNPDDIVEKIYLFVMERLRAYYLEQSIVPEVFDAVMAQQPIHPFDFHQRVKAVSEFIKLPDAESLATANKRIANILRKAEFKSGSVTIDAALMQETAEKDLAALIDQMENDIQPAIKNGDYHKVLTQLSGLRQAVDQFFDDVMVMAEDDALRNNRLALLARIRALFLEVADISRLHIG